MDVGGSGSRPERPAAGGRRIQAMAEVPRPRFPRIRVVLLGLLLVLTVIAIRKLGDALPEDRVTVLIGRFEAGDDPRLAGLTDRVATRLSTHDRVRMVVLDHGDGDDPSAGWLLDGRTTIDGDTFRVEVRLRALGGSAPAQERAWRDRLDRLDAVAAEIAEWAGSHL